MSERQPPPAGRRPRLRLDARARGADPGERGAARAPRAVRARGAAPVTRRRRSSRRRRSCSSPSASSARSSSRRSPPRSSATGSALAGLARGRARRRRGRGLRRRPRRGRRARLAPARLLRGGRRDAPVVRARRRWWPRCPALRAAPALAPLESQGTLVVVLGLLGAGLLAATAVFAGSTLAYLVTGTGPLRRVVSYELFVARSHLRLSPRTIAALFGIVVTGLVPGLLVALGWSLVRDAQGAARLPARRAVPARPDAGDAPHDAHLDRRRRDRRVGAHRRALGDERVRGRPQAEDPRAQRPRDGAHLRAGRASTTGAACARRCSASRASPARPRSSTTR